MSMASSRKKGFDVPLSLFDEAEEESRVRPIKPSPLEKFLGRSRDPETGKLVPKKTSRKRTVAASSFARTLVETQAMVDSRDWSACGPRHLVALYDLMHRKTYGVEPTMSGTERYQLTLMSGGFVKRAFGGEIGKALEYLRWVWTREIGREKYRRENGREGGRLSLRFIMSNTLLDDYRVAMSRKR